RGIALTPRELRIRYRRGAAPQAHGILLKQLNAANMVGAKLFPRYVARYLAAPRQFKDVVAAPLSQWMSGNAGGEQEFVGEIVLSSQDSYFAPFKRGGRQSFQGRGSFRI